MCGQFGIPFWKFFLATLIGKAVIKTHIQVDHLPFILYGEIVGNFVLDLWYSVFSVPVIFQYLYKTLNVKGESS